MTLFLIILGTFIAIFERFATAQTKENFQIKTFWRKNWAIFALNFLTSLGIYFAAFQGESLPVWRPFWDWNLFNLVIIFTGTISLYVWKLCISVYKIIIEKFVGKITDKNY